MLLPSPHMAMSVAAAASSHQDVPPQSPAATLSRAQKSYDFLLKFLLVGDSDVGKEEFLQGLETGSSESPYFDFLSGIDFKTTIILLDGKRVKLQLWDTSGQGRFCTIFRSYSRGAHGILLVYDISNKWSFDGLDRWIREVDQHAPGVPKILVGNRCHLAYKRQVSEQEAEEYAQKHNMTFFEVSPLCDFNVQESLVELSRVALKRNGMGRTWGHSKVLSLQELCCRTIASHTTVYGVEHLPLPSMFKTHLRSYLQANRSHGRTTAYHSSTLHREKSRRSKIIHPSDSPHSLRSSCRLS